MNELRCGKCGKKLATNLDGSVEIVCPKSNCHTYNKFNSADTVSMTAIKFFTITPMVIKEG